MSHPTIVIVEPQTKPTQVLCEKCLQPMHNRVGVHGRVFSNGKLIDCQYQPIEEEAKP